MQISTISHNVTANPTGYGRLLSPDTFLTLLLTELRYQDPLDPLDSQAMVAQLATLQQVTESRLLRESQQFAQALGLLGKQVTWEKNGLTGSGVVQRVLRNGTTIHLVAGDTTIGLDEIRHVSL